MSIIRHIFMLNTTGTLLFGVFIVNTLIHYVVDNEKANKGHLNLMADQFIHLSQIFVSWVILCQWI